MGGSGQVGHYASQTVEPVESALDVRIGTPLRYE